MSPQETTTVAAPCRGTECEQHERVGFVDLCSSHVLHLFHSIHLSKMCAISTKQNYQEYQQIPLCIRAPPKQGRYWEIHPQRPRDILRPKRFSQGEAWGKSWGSREITIAIFDSQFPNTSLVLVEYRYNTIPPASCSQHHQSTSSLSPQKCHWPKYGI